MSETKGRVFTLKKTATDKDAGRYVSTQHRASYLNMLFFLVEQNALFLGKSAYMKLGDVTDIQCQVSSGLRNLKQKCIQEFYPYIGTSKELDEQDFLFTLKPNDRSDVTITVQVSNLHWTDTLGQPSQNSRSYTEANRYAQSRSSTLVSPNEDLIQKISYRVCALDDPSFKIKHSRPLF